MEDEGGLQELQQEKGRVRRDKGGRGGGMIGQTGWADGEVVEEQGWWGFRGPETRSWKFPSFVCALIETSHSPVLLE